MTTKNKPNTGIRNNSMFCFNCGTEQAIPFPISIPMMSVMTKQFDKEHKNCKPTWKQPVNENAHLKSEAENLIWWLNHGEKGLSSLTIVKRLTASYNADLVDYSGANEKAFPRDPDDFKRCEFLLQAVPQYREKLAHMKQAGPVWSNLVDNWETLRGMLEEQLQGKPNNMYELMKELGC